MTPTALEPGTLVAVLDLNGHAVHMYVHGTHPTSTGPVVQLGRHPEAATTRHVYPDDILAAGRLDDVAGEIARRRGWDAGEHACAIAKAYGDWYADRA